MNDNFIVEPNLFYNAKRNITNVVRREETLLKLADDLIANFPPEYIYADNVTEIYNDINIVKPVVNEELLNLISHERMLIELDNDFKEYAKTRNNSIINNSEGFLDLLLDTGATIVVGTTSILNGALGTLESVLDGVITCPFISSLIMNDNSNRNLERRLLDFVRRDLVKELNSSFYDNTKLGENINNRSFLKYDSKTAHAITTGAAFVSKAAAATLLTMYTGPAGAAIVGSLSGIGKANQKYAQSVDRENDKDYNFKKAGLKSLGGAIVGGVEWYSLGQLGSFAVSATPTIARAMSNTGGNVVTRTIRNTSIRGNVLRNSINETIRAENIALASSDAIDSGIDFYTKDITGGEFAKEFATLTAGYLLVSGLGGFADSLSTFTLSKSGIIPRTLIPRIAEVFSLINNSDNN